MNLSDSLQEDLGRFSLDTAEGQVLFGSARGTSGLPPVPDVAGTRGECLSLTQRDSDAIAPCHVRASERTRKRFGI